MMALLAGIAAAVGIAVATVPLARFPVERSPAVPVGEVAVVQRLVDLSQPVRLQLDWTPGLDVRSGTAGLVTSLVGSVGDDVSCGEVMLTVEDRPVIAFCGPQPLWRDVGPDSIGSDATAVRVFLVDVGALDSPEGTEDAFVAGVRSFRQERGLPPGDTLGPETLAWIGSGDGASIGTIPVQVGTMVAPSDVVMTLAPELRTARLADPPTTHPSSDFGFAVPGRDDVFAISTNATIVDLDALAASLGDVARSNDQLPDQLDGVIRLVEPLDAWAVPATAIITSGSATCVRVVDRAGAPVPVVVIDYAAGTAMVTGDLDAGATVVADPGDQQCS